ncbi:MAG: hypothetical protein ABW003_29170 [Microvirga sp.]
MPNALAWNGLTTRIPHLLKHAPTGLLALGSLATWTLPAEAHVKWFAPYIVDAAPQPVGATLSNIWFWTGSAWCSPTSWRHLPQSAQ